MANILKDGKTYVDKHGVSHSDPYMVIDHYYGAELPDPFLRFTVRIYHNQTAKDNNKVPIIEDVIRMEAADVATYLGTGKVALATEIPAAFIKKHIYIFLGTEKPPVESVVWDDWKSDEVGGVPQIKNTEA